MKDSDLMVLKFDGFKKKKESCFASEWAVMLVVGAFFAGIALVIWATGDF